MNWLDDLLHARASKEQEAKTRQKQHRERMDRAFRRSDRMVTRSLRDLGRAYWANKISWKVDGYLPSNGWAPHWKLQAHMFAGGEIFFSVELCETFEGSEAWYFKVYARELDVATEDDSEDALKMALRAAFVAGPTH